MSSKSDYTTDEWAALVRAPLLAGLSLTLADPGGPIEAAKETIAAMKVMTEPGSQTGLVVEVAREARTMMEARQNPIGDFKPEAKRAGEQILDELRRVTAILRAKATPEEAAAFRGWLTKAAQSAADAAKEGGFLGFGAVKVSEGEQKMLGQIAAALADGPLVAAGAGGVATEGEAETTAATAGTPEIDLALCTGCGICADICPDVFEIGDDGFSHVIEEALCDEAGCCLEAADECPEGAISIE